MARSELPEGASLESRQQEENFNSGSRSESDQSTADFSLRFWGVRGSYPVPGSGTVRYGGNTACVEIRNSHHRLILDAGTGVIGLGQSIVSEYRSHSGSLPVEADSLPILTILLSHTHYDHIQGLPFFEPAYSNKFRIFVYGPQLLGLDLEDSLAQAITGRNCPLSLDELKSQKQIRNLEESDTLIFSNSRRHPVTISKEQSENCRDDSGFVVNTMRSFAHPKDGVFVFRIDYNGKRVVYATDVEGYAGGDSKLIEFAQDADVLIHDAQYTHHEYSDIHNPRQGYGHSTVEMACEVAQKANARQLILFHHDPHHDDDQIDRMVTHARTLFSSSRAAHENMEIQVLP